MKATSALATFVGVLFTCSVCLAQTPAATETTNTTSDAAAPEPVLSQPSAIIPLIQFQEVALTTAIENLARQAGLNYILDPRVPYGQPDATGKLTPQPSISIRWENLTAEQALSALLTVYNLQIIQDAKTHVSRITVKDPAAPEPMFTRIIQLKYAGVTNMLAPIQATLITPKARVIGDIRSSQLVVVATDKELEAVENLVIRLDTPTRQVLIEARLMEISRSPSTVKGIDWSGTLRGQNISFGNGITTSKTTTTTGTPTSTTTPDGETITGTGTTKQSVIENIAGGLGGGGGLSLNTASGFSPATAFLNADGVSAVLSFLNADADTQVISTPRAVTLDNETALLSVTRATPIFKSTAGTQGSPGGSEVQYTNLGTILTVTPRISANDFIWLKVIPEVSSIFRTVEKLSGGQRNQADEYDIRKIQTQVLIPSGNTLVMGGLMSDSTKNIYSKVPILGDVPLLGRAFSHENKARDKRNLLIFVTPTVVKDTDYQVGNRTTFLQTRPTEMNSAIDLNSPYDSARRHDWSNPGSTAYDTAEFNDGAAFSTQPAPVKP